MGTDSRWALDGVRSDGENARSGWLAVDWPPPIPGAFPVPEPPERRVAVAIHVLCAPPALWISLESRRAGHARASEDQRSTSSRVDRPVPLIVIRLTCSAF